MRALITGAAGFAARALIQALGVQGHEVVAADIRTPDQPLEGVAAFLPLDITDAQATWEAVHQARPDLLLHLAGVSHVGKAEADPDLCFAVNTQGTRNLLDACLDGHANVRVLVVSSAEVYGRVAAAQLPVREDHPLRPATTYAVSKACAEMHAHHAAARGLHVVVARAFNHIGRGQSPDFVAPAFARQVAAIEAGQQAPVLQVGNLSAVRDFSHVSDTVLGYLACLDAGEPGDVFNVTSGAAVAISEVLETLLSLSSVPIRVEQDSARMRAVDVPLFHGDGGLLRRRSGFAPSFDLKASLSDVLDDWRQRLKAELH